ncbi:MULTISPECIES: hypothetical protein [unclassified Tolypothrix]|uniref:hypothetical protein n=1 Tax=unclassified Tolypothrix TaxID=2649714 RepID=UPI0005EAB4A0|nr:MULTISPECIES: hypothetical protein [unclassified Tolypothrix]EKE99292.1 hypothetical protein FDUTEX481_10158 [Tolypothrix sp. PCC 7601]UYD36905.1 hypothetical protein HG267_14945 [Tolypothrix sp. PCC 7601]
MGTGDWGLGREKANNFITPDSELSTQYSQCPMPYEYKLILYAFCVLLSRT